MSLLLNALFLTAALSHLGVDILNSQRVVLFTYLSETLGLTNAQLGLYSTIYILAASLLQPLFGYLADKYGPRWIISGGLAWMGIFFSLGLTTPGIGGLVLLAIASIGSGAVHPAGAMQATLYGQERKDSRETTAASVFFLFGQLGYFFGPLLGGLLLDNYGSKSLLSITVFVLLMAVFSSRTLRNSITNPEKSAQEIEDEKQERKLNGGTAALVMFALMAASQSWASSNMSTFLPKFLSDLGQTSTQYGFFTSLYMAGGAVGNVVAGSLADRFSKRRVTAVSLALASIPIALITVVGWSPWLYVVVPLAGAFTGASYAIIIVLAQRLIPSGKALASGLILGFLFSAGALGVQLSGWHADIQGLPAVFLVTAGLVLFAGVMALSLPKTSKQIQKVN
jgi:FSR family fosmidomycin resistance protein-like MFS transporter